jgi:hypothetical protein
MRVGITHEITIDYIYYSIILLEVISLSSILISAAPFYRLR